MSGGSQGLSDEAGALSPLSTSDEESDCADACDVHKTLIATSHATALKAVYAPLVFILTDVFGFNHAVNFATSGADSTGAPYSLNKIIKGESCNY